MDITTMTAAVLSKELASGRLSSTELVSAELRKIKDNDDDSAFITVCADEALKAAGEADRRRADGRILSFLDGVPISLGDNIMTRGIKTTCASKMLRDFVPPYDAAVVEKLKSAGLVIIGKTNLDEFAMGSSSEAAAAVAAFMTPLALGSDTGGSLRQSAGLCGVYGFRPTYGAVCRYGLAAAASSMDTVGVIARSARDVRLLCDIIYGVDSRDASSINIKLTESEKPDFSSMSFALPDELFADAGENAVSAAEETAAKLAALGMTRKTLRLPSLKYALAAFIIISCAEAASNLVRFDGVGYGYRTGSYDDMNELFENTRGEGFGQEVKRRILLGGCALSADFREKWFFKAKAAAALIRAELDKALSDIDIIVAPTSANPAGNKTSRNIFETDITLFPASLAGLPALSIPAGLYGGIPTGVQLISARRRDGLILYTAEILAETETER